MTPSVWVAVLHISPRTAQKIVHKHGIQPEEVQDAVVCRRGLVFTWDDDAQRGRRAIIETHVRGTKTLVVLYPDNNGHPDVWHLGSAYPHT